MLKQQVAAEEVVVVVEEVVEEVVEVVVEVEAEAAWMCAMLIPS